jgi:Arm DNA-binding domain
MPRKAIGLTAAKVRTAEPGRYGDGGGLYLLVRPEGGRFWLFSYVIDKKMREMGLGAASGRDAIMLTDARTAARKLWEAVRAGRDPLNDRKAEAEAQKAAALAGRPVRRHSERCPHFI